MDQPWGLSGPEFLLLYAVGFGVALLVMFTAQAALGRVGGRRGADDVGLDVYQAAYLAGGQRRVVDTAIAGLALRDQVLVSRNGRLTLATGVAGDGPVEAAVCSALRRTNVLSKVRKGMRRDPAVLALGEQVRSRGLLLSGTRVFWWRVTTLLPVAVLGVGLVRMANGISLGRPVGILVVLLVISLFVLVLLLPARLRTSERPSALGRAVLRHLRRQHRTRSRGTRAPAADWQLAGVAVVGFSAIADPTLHRALATPTGSGGGGGSGCGGGGSSSGCGGGGSGCGG